MFRGYVEVKRIHPDAQLPTYGTEQATGADLRSVEDGVLKPGEWRAIPTGLQMAPLAGWTVDLQIRPRSGLAYKNGVTVLNSPGTIDRDYRGEVKVILINHGTEDFEYHVGDRIAQIVTAPSYSAKFIEVDELDLTERGSGGFGSTGIK